ncbi:SagG family ABC transporter permease subunit [Clostridium oceanicum]|uniref:SagG family ABC transporter permease subunit n=1 Tax=Clostridium oceanicum TaxID=1543 RepID=A0ABN1J8R7_9CLOT
MILLSIIKKELIQNLRDKKSMFMMVIFPLIMIGILGMSLSSVFTSSKVISKSKVLYSINDKYKLGKDFKDFTKSIEKDMNIEFKEVKKDKDIYKYIEDSKYDCYIKISSNDKIQLYNNNLRDFNSKLVESLINTFIQKNNGLEQIGEDNPRSIEKINLKKEPNFVKIQSVVGNKKPSSIDYYSVTMFTMIILYGSAVGAGTVMSENRRNTLKRVYTSYAGKGKLALGKIIGSLIIVFFQVMLVFLFSKYMFHAYWGNHIKEVILIALTLVIMSVSIGIGAATMSKNQNVVSIIINMAIPIMVFLGGGYLPLNMFGKIFSNVSHISPIKWTNDAIFKIIYSNDFTYMSTAITINLIIAAVFILPVILKKKEAY